jgi:hypothetical protein
MHINPSWTLLAKRVVSSSVCIGCLAFHWVFCVCVLGFIYLRRESYAQGWEPAFYQFFDAEEGGISGVMVGVEYSMMSFMIMTIVSGLALIVYPLAIHECWNLRQRLRVGHSPSEPGKSARWLIVLQRFATSRFGIGCQVVTIIYCVATLVWLFTVREVFAKGSIPSLSDDGLIMLPLDRSWAMTALFILVLYRACAIFVLLYTVEYCRQHRRRLKTAVPA